PTSSPGWMLSASSSPNTRPGRSPRRTRVTGSASRRAASRSEKDRAPRRELQPGARRAPGDQPLRRPGARPRRGLVAGLAGQPAQAEARHGATRRADAFGPGDGPARADPRDRDRTGARHALHDRHAAGPKTALPAPQVRLADGGRQPRAIPLVEGLARDSPGNAD